MTIFIRKGKSNWKYILIIVILSLIVVGESFLLIRQEINIPEIKLPQKATQDETADWKSYRNKEYEFEIKYPLDYFISSTDKRVEIAHNKWKDQLINHPYISIEVFETIYSADEWIENNIKEKREDGFGTFEEGCEMHCISATAKEIKIGGNIQALKYRVWGVSGGGDYIVTEKEGISNWLVVIYSHIAGARDPGEESVPADILDKMLSTFRFLE